MSNISYALRLDREFEESLKGKEDLPAKKYLLHFKGKPKMKSSIQVSNILSNLDSAEAAKINNTIIRKKLLELTFSFLEPFHIYFMQQYNVL